MTKQEFESGTPFRVKGPHNNFGSSTYYYENKSISKQIRSNIDESVLTDSYHLNVEKISRVGFEGFVFVMSKRVNVKLRFEDLMAFEEVL